MSEQVLLDIKGAQTQLNELGMGVSERQVRRMADENRLPFFKGPTGQRVIFLDELVGYLRGQQIAATRQIREAANSNNRRGR